MNIEFNHIAMRCKNIDAVATFFTEVIGLEKGFLSSPNKLDTKLQQFRSPK